MGEKQRKTRSDKKRPIAPYIPDEHRIKIKRLAVRLRVPETDVGLHLVRRALDHPSTIDFFRPYFRRDYRLNNRLVISAPIANDIAPYIEIKDQPRSRYKIKPLMSDYERLTDFQIALGLNYLAHATYAILKFALNNQEILQLLDPGFRESVVNAVPVEPTAKESVAAPINPSSTTSVWSILKVGD